MRALLVMLTVFACAGAILPWYPFSSEALWPIGMVARELWPWLLVANLVGVALASQKWRLLQLVFLGGASAALWPLVQMATMKRDFARQWSDQGFAAAALHEPEIGAVLKTSFGGYDATLVEPQTLPLGILYYAPPEAPRGLRPILIAIHGGSWQHGGARDNADFTSHFANAGWAVFSLEYRLAPQHPHPAQVDDVRASIAWIYEHARELGADPGRIALAGRSAGGHLAMLAGYTSENVPIRAIVNYYGPGDLAEVYRDPQRPDPIDRPDKLEALLGGSPDGAPDAYRNASPATYARAGLPPTLHLQGRYDHIVTPGIARRFHERLLANGSRSLFLELPWSDHSFDFVYFGPAATLALAYIETFLNSTVERDSTAGLVTGGEASPAP